MPFRPMTRPGQEKTREVGVLPDYSVLSGVPAPLLDWYHRSRRVLPWREDPQPYHVWLSEIMLQQTRVEAALPYYHRFLAALPTVADLAAAPEEQLLKLWEGLGYYSRVRNLQKAARVVVEQYDGRLPADYERILALPGIGDYTAGAICSIAFGLPTPAVDGNVLRVLSRVLGDSRDITQPKLKAEYRQELAGLYPTAGPAGDFTQALMELGATVCLPNGAPQCLICPLRPICAGYASGDPMALPCKPPKKQRRVEHRRVWLVFSPVGVLLHRRAPRGLLAGLWELPGAPEGEPFPLPELELPEGEPAGTARHIFSHVQWEMQGVEVQLPESVPLPGDWRWADARELRQELALPSAFRGFLPAVLEHLKTEQLEQ